MGLELRRPALFYGAAVCLAVGLVFHNVLDNGFTYDDRSIVVENQVIRQVDLGQIFSTNYWHGYQGHNAGLYRPLVILSYALTHSLAGLDPFYYHLGNLALHLGCSLLVFSVGCLLLGAPRAAGLAALLFALHPVHTEVVANVAGRKELLAAFFFFAAWRAYARSRGLPWVAAGLFGAALLAKEDAVLLWMVLAADDWRRGGDLGAVWRRRRMHWVLMGAPVAVYMGVRLWVLGAAGAASTTSLALENPLVGADPATRLLSVVGVFGRYFELLLWPVDLKADYSFNQFPAVTTPWNPSWLLALVAVGLSFWLGWRARREPVGFAVYFFYATLAVVSNLLFTIGTPLAERFLYVPSAAFCWLGGLALYRLGRGRGTATVVVALLALAAYGTRAAARNPVWKDNAIFFERNAETSPNSARARYHLGMEHYQDGRMPEALAEFGHAVSIAPDHANAHYMSGLLHLAREDWAAAVNAFEQAIDAARGLGLPAEYRAEVETRLLLARGGQALAADQAEHARAFFAEALSMGPAEALARVHLARAHWARGDTAGVRRSLRGAGSIGEARTLRADLLRLRGREDEALPLYRKAVDELLAQRRWAAAARALEPLLERDPDDRAFLLRRARLAAFSGDLQGAVQQVGVLAQRHRRWAAPLRYLGAWQARLGNGEAARVAYVDYLALERDPSRRAAAEERLARLE